MKKNKKIIEQPEETMEDLPFAPPELHYLAERYTVRIPITDKHFESRWELRVYAEKVLEEKLGDSVQLTSMRVKKPHLISKTKSKLRKEVPHARLLVTVKF
jgi:hypothetical protein